MALTAMEMAKKYWDMNLMEGLLTHAGQKWGAQYQYKLVIGLYTMAKRDGWFQQWNSIGLLAHDIQVSQNDKIARFGEKAFPLTESQIQAIGRDLRQCGRWADTKEGEPERPRLNLKSLEG